MLSQNTLRKEWIHLFLLLPHHVRNNSRIDWCPFSIWLATNQGKEQHWIQNQFGVGLAAPPFNNQLSMETIAVKHFIMNLWPYTTTINTSFIIVNSLFNSLCKLGNSYQWILSIIVTRWLWSRPPQREDGKACYGILKCFMTSSKVYEIGSLRGPHTWTRRNKITDK